MWKDVEGHAWKEVDADAEMTCRTLRGFTATSFPLPNRTVYRFFSSSNPAIEPMASLRLALVSPKSFTCVSGRAGRG